MKSLNYYLVSSICAVIVGVLLIANPSDAVSYLVVAIGALFLIPGIVGMYSFFRTLKRKDVAVSPSVMVLVVSIGSLLLGLWLMIMPQFFIGALMYVLGVLIVLCGLNQLASLVSVNRSKHVPAYLFFFPIIVLLTGILILVNPFEAASVSFTILGVAFLVYGVSDLVRLFSYKPEPKSIAPEVQTVEAETVEENKEAAEKTEPEATETTTESTTTPSETLPSTND